MAKIKTVIPANADNDTEKLDYSHGAAGKVECYSHSGKQ